MFRFFPIAFTSSLPPRRTPLWRLWLSALCERSGQAAWADRLVASYRVAVRVRK